MVYLHGQLKHPGRVNTIGEVCFRIEVFFVRYCGLLPMDQLQRNMMWEIEVPSAIIVGRLFEIADDIGGVRCALIETWSVSVGTEYYSA